MAAVAAAAVVAVSLEEEVVAAEVVAVFRGAAAAVSRDPAAVIFREEVPVAPAGRVRGISPALVATGAVVWLIPETPRRATEVPLAASD